MVVLPVVEREEEREPTSVRRLGEQEPTRGKKREWELKPTSARRLGEQEPVREPTSGRRLGEQELVRGPTSVRRRGEQELEWEPTSVRQLGERELEPEPTRRWMREWDLEPTRRWKREWELKPTTVPREEEEERKQELQPTSCRHQGVGELEREPTNVRLEEAREWERLEPTSAHCLRLANWTRRAKSPIEKRWLLRQ